MTADERIEKLLNRFGQTISDLPKPRMYWAYTSVHRDKASETALKLHKADDSPQAFIPDTLKLICCTDYICHLADVIDRMEAALETAVLWAACITCSKYKDCVGCEDMQDYQLNDILKYDILQKETE